MLKTDDKQNIRGAAAVLAEDAKQLNNGVLPVNVGDWHVAVSEYSGSVDPQTAQNFADSVFGLLQSGQSRTTDDGQKLQLNALKGLTLNKQPLQSLLLTPEAQSSLNARQDNPWKPECPTGLDCRFIPAAYTQNNPDDPADYGNYDLANRPKDMKIKYIVIHDTEGSYDSAISWFQNPASYVSCNYVIRSSDGQVTQMVQNQGVAWCAGDWYVNMHSINIEHEGEAADGAAWYTEAMYQSSAKLVKYLSKKYDIPLDREHIIGHDNVPTLSAARMAGQHYDPGPYWDWNHYMALLHNRTDDAERRFEASSGSKIVTISPKVVGHVYLRTQPNASAPLLTDPHLHPGGEPGTTNIEDWSATAATGQKFAVADKQGDWTAIWFGSQKGWFYNPSGANQMAYFSKGKTVTPKAGKTSIDVYGGAYPEASAYPSTIPVQSSGPIYTISAGQKYVSGGNVPTDYFYDATINWSKPDDHMIVKGNEKYLQITYNHRIAYVKASDVDIQ
jgi:N-acetyl-anhydromuramyl-L-alanine amidase AmpD